MCKATIIVAWLSHMEQLNHESEDLSIESISHYLGPQISQLNYSIWLSHATKTRLREQASFMAPQRYTLGSMTYNVAWLDKQWSARMCSLPPCFAKPAFSSRLPNSSMGFTKSLGFSHFWKGVASTKWPLRAPTLLVRDSTSIPMVIRDGKA